MAAKKTSEYITVRSHFHNICQALSGTPSSIPPLANDLCSVKVIGHPTQNAVCYTKGLTPYEQASQLLSAAHVTIEYDQSKFYEFVSKLETHGHEALARTLYLSCESNGGRPAPSLPSSSTKSNELVIDLSHSSLVTPPSLIDLTNLVAAPLLHKWRDVGIQLGLKPSEMDVFYDHRNRESNQCFMDVFDSWEKLGRVPYTWKAILKALTSPSVNEIDLATDIYIKITSGQL